jgi:hypothetical protein
MADPATPPDGSPAPLSSMKELVDAWTRFRAGEVVPCPNDSASLALSVDASAGVYRFVCTTCGTASSWFESGPTGSVEVRPLAAPPPPPE